MATSVIQSREYRAMRAELKAVWQPRNQACGICGQATIDWDAPANDPDSFELHHPKSRKRYPHLALDRSNAVAAHCRCNRSLGMREDKPTIGENTEDW